MIQSKADRTRRNRAKEGFLVGGTQGFCNRSEDQAGWDLEEGLSRNGGDRNLSHHQKTNFLIWRVSSGTLKYWCSRGITGLGGRHRTMWHLGVNKISLGGQKGWSQSCGSILKFSQQNPLSHAKISQQCFSKLRVYPEHLGMPVKHGDFLASLRSCFRRTCVGLGKLHFSKYLPNRTKAVWMQGQAMPW